MTAAGGMGYQEGSYQQKLNLLPRTIAEWLRPHGGIDGKDILDFACGEATIALGLTRHHAPRFVLGVDIMPDVHLCLPLASRQLGLDRLPVNLQLRQIQPGPLDCPDGSFDLIYSWSVFEHVDRDLFATVLQDLRRLLRPAGHLFIQISPLYYTSQGSHLGGLVSESWGHLTNQLDTYRRKLRDACPDDEIFSILWSTYTTSDSPEPPRSLLHAYDHAALTTDQVVLLAARDDAPAALTPQLDDGRARFRLGKRTRGLLRRIMGTARP